MTVLSRRVRTLVSGDRRCTIRAKAGVLTAIAVASSALMPPGAAVAAGLHGSSGVPWVAYQSSLRGQQFGPDGIFLVRPDGSDDHEIATGVPDDHMHPDWSADGRSLVFRADIGDSSRLFLTNPVTDPTGYRARQLLGCSGDCIQVDDPALSPDGRSIAYVEDTGPPVVIGQVEVPESFDLRVARISRRGLTDVRTVLQTHTLTELVEPRWSPDGASLVFWSDHTDSATRAVDGAAVFTVRADGTGLRQVAPWSMMAGEADWSPDGRRLVFVTHPLILFNFADVVSNLYTVRPSGHDIRQLTFASTSADRATQARWTSTGRIIYTRVTSDGRALWVRNVSGDDPIPIAPGGRAIRSHGDLQPVRND